MDGLIVEDYGVAKSILIIDDDPTLLTMLKSFLESHGYVVDTADGGEKGLEQIKIKVPDLIVLDVQMPKMNGYTFVMELKKDVAMNAVPIVVLTAKEGMSEIFKVEGVKEYMTKPFHPQKFLELIKKYV